MRDDDGWLLCVWNGGVGNKGKDIYETRDGGATWQLRARAPFAVKAVGRLGTYGYPTGLAFGADGHGWIPQECGSLLATRDGGRRWHDLAITEPEVRLALSASLVSAEAGFAVIRDGRRQRYELDRTNDGGRTWHLVHAWPM